MRFVTSILVIVLSGCSTAPTWYEMYPWLFPTAEFTSEGVTSFADDLQKTSETISRNLITQGIDSTTLATSKNVLYSGFGTNETERMLLDPFLTQRYQYVRYETLTPGDQVVCYYQHLFAEAKWKFERCNLQLEDTLAGGDVVQVYMHDKALVRLHVFGPLREPPMNGRDGFCTWTIEFSFIGLRPDALLGKEYRHKGQEPFFGLYHVGEVLRNLRTKDEHSSN